MAMEKITHFKNHAEYLNKAFKTNFKTFTKSRYSYSEDIWIWFVNFDLKKNNDWKIDIDVDYVRETYMIDKCPPYYYQTEKKYRFVVLFEEKEDGNTYYNLGLYEYDHENSDEYNSVHTFKRFEETKGISDNVNRHLEKKDVAYCRPNRSDCSPAPVCARMIYPSEKSVSPRFDRNEAIIEALKNMDKGFSETLFYYIDKKGITDIECYKRARVDRKIFSKIKCNDDYRPSKNTAIAFAIALQLTVTETNHLLRTLGYSLSNSNKFDVIIECCIQKQQYDMDIINMILLDFDQSLLGY